MSSGRRFLGSQIEYYSDEEAVSWQLSSDLVEQDIQNAGGIIVGISMMWIIQ